VGSRQRSVGVSRLGRFARGRRPDRNPLRRTSDRVETAVLAVLVITFLAAAPFAALASGTWEYARAHNTQLMQETSWHQVPALVLKATSGVQGDGGYGVPASQVQARWTAPDGQVVTGEIAVPPGTAARTSVQLWVTGDGQPTGPPLQGSQVASDAVFAGMASVIALAILLYVTGMLARRALDKRRMAAWDSQWRSTEPRWSFRP
jgi:hypothetical protein